MSRYAVLGVRSQAIAGTAAVFLDELVGQMAFPVMAVQVDGGSGFLTDFGGVSAVGDPVLCVATASPKLNGRVERLNVTCRREFWEWYDGDLDLPIPQHALRAFEVFYNHERLHQALGYRTSASILTFSYASN